MKFIALIKALLIDRSKADEVQSLNDILSEIANYYSPGSGKKKTTYEEQVKTLESFTKVAGKKIKLKNFKKVSDGRAVGLQS